MSKGLGLIRNSKKENGFFVFTTEDLKWIDRCIRADFVHSKPDDPQSSMIPVWTCAQDLGTKRNYTINELTTFVVAKLDIPRAVSLLNKLQNIGVMDSTNGIYIVSYLTPILGNSEKNPSMIMIQDLTRLPADYVESWVLLTKEQFNKSDYWNKNLLDYTILTVRTTLARAAPAVELTEKALSSKIIGGIFPISSDAGRVK